MASRRVRAMVIAAVLLAASAQAMGAGVSPQVGERQARARRIRQAIQRGVAFLQRDQLPYGEFPVYWREEYGFTWHEVEGVFPHKPGQLILDSTPYATAHILYSLQFVKDRRVAGMVRKGLAFLLEQMEPGGLWRYWSSHTFRHKKMLLNINETSLSGLALLAHGRSFPHDLRLLEQFKTSEGRFMTYLLTPETMPTPEQLANDQMIRTLHDSYYMFNTPDCVQNGNVLAYLARQGVAAPPVCDFLLRVMRQGGNPQPCSLYYRSKFAVMETVSRAYREGASCLEAAGPIAVELLAQQQQPDGAWDAKPLETAFGAITLLNFDAPGPVVDRAVDYLLATQHPDGSWPWAYLYGTVYSVGSGWGSTALTTGFVLEALSKALARS